MGWGRVPYAAEYGAEEGAARGPLGDFVAQHMGVGRGGGATEGPGAEAAPPPLVFDADVLEGPAAPLANLFSRKRSVVFPRSRERPGLQQFILGPGGAGSALHFHPAAVNLCVFGLKMWVIVPPGAAAFSEEHVAAWWPRRASAGPAFEALQGPGDFVFVPEGWGHAVINLADSLALAFEAKQ